MAAVNKHTWRYSRDGRTAPIRQRFPVAAGTTRTIKIGEICYMTGDVPTGDLVPVAASTDNLHPFVIADEEQKAGDAARFLMCIIPTPADVFEFALDAGTVINFGEELQISDSQTLKSSTTDPIAAAVDVPAPTEGTTWPTLTNVRCSFKRSGINVDLPWLSEAVGDAV